MKKSTDKFFKILSEAIKNRNPYGVDTGDKEVNPFFKPLKLEKDYSYHGEYKEIPDKIKSERNKLYKKEDLTGKISLRNKKNKELEELQEIQQIPLLIGQKGELEKRKTSVLQKDLISLSKEIAEIKNTYTTYSARLTQVLKTFFTVPGANIAKRYIILPLKRDININDVNKLNLDRSKTGDMLNSLLNNKEIIADRETDGEIKKYLTSFGYHFKNDNDLYNDICYTSNGAKIKISDEFAKINKIDVINKKKFIDKTTDVIKREQAMNEMRKKENLTDKFMARMDLINTESIKNENIDDINVVVITWVPRLIMSQSTTTIWSSCMKLQDESGEGGVNKHYIPSSIENGVFIAWLVNIKDIKTINKPLARILIKPFVVKDRYVEEQDKMADFIWWASDMYHDGSNNADIRIFASCVKNFCYRKQYKTITNMKKKLNDRFILEIQKDQYKDNSDRGIDFGLSSLKDIYNNIQNSLTGERDFFNATDYSDKKMFFYLKKLNPQKLEFYLERMLSRSLETNNLSAFDYLSKINKQKTNETVGAYLAYFCTREDPYRYTFIIYLLKYYYQDIRRQDKDYFIQYLFDSVKHDDIKDFIYKEKKILIDFLANNGPKNNYSFLAKIFPYLGSDFIKKTNDVKNILNIINKNNIISLFEINKESQESACDLFFYFDSMYEKMSKDLQKEYDIFYNTIKKSINNFFINKYLIKSVSFSSSSKIGENVRVRKNCFEFMKIGKEKNIIPHNINKNFMMSIDVAISEKSKKIDSEFFNKLMEYGYITDDIATDYNNIPQFLSKIDFENFKKYFELYVSSLKGLHSNMFFDLLSDIACDRSMTEESRNKKVQYIYEKYSHVMNKDDTSRLIFVYYLPTITNEIDYDFVSSLMKKYDIEMDNDNILTVIRSYKKNNILFVKNISHLMNLAKLKKLIVKNLSTDAVLTNYIFNNSSYYDSPILVANYKYFISILDIDNVIEQIDINFEKMNVNLICFLINTYLVKILFKDGKLKKNKKILDIIMRGINDISQYPECLESFRYIFDDDYEKTVNFLINDSSYTVEHSIFKINQIFNISLNDFKNSKAFQKMIDEIKKGMLREREDYVYKKYDTRIFNFDKFFNTIKENNRIKFFEDNFEKSLIENDRLYLCFDFIRIMADSHNFHKTKENENYMNEKFIEYCEIMREEKENYNNYYAFLSALITLVDHMNMVDFDDVFPLLSFCKMIIVKKENSGKKISDFTDFIHNFEYVKTIFLRRNNNTLTEEQKIEIDKV